MCVRMMWLVGDGGEGQLSCVCHVCVMCVSCVCHVCVKCVCGDVIQSRVSHSHMSQDSQDIDSNSCTNSG